MSELLTIDDVARFCQVHKATVRRHIAAGRLRSIRVGRAVRVRQEDLDSYLGAGRNPLPQPVVEGNLRPFSLEDPLWELVGMSDNPENWWVSGDKRRALSEAYASKQ